MSRNVYQPEAVSEHPSRTLKLGPGASSLLIVDLDVVSFGAGSVSALRIDGSRCAVLRDGDLGCADDFVAFFLCENVVIRVGALGGDAVRAVGHGARSWIVFAVELHREAVGYS